MVCDREQQGMGMETPEAKKSLVVVGGGGGLKSNIVSVPVPLLGLGRPDG